MPMVLNNVFAERLYVATHHQLAKHVVKKELSIGDVNDR